MSPRQIPLMHATICASFICAIFWALIPPIAQAGIEWDIIENCLNKLKSILLACGLVREQKQDPKAT